MIWNNDTQSYRGETSDNKVVDVAGDEWAESLHDGIKALMQENSDFDEFGLSVELVREKMPQLYDHLEDKVLKELDDPDMWAGLVGDNQNVEYVG